MMRTLFGVQKMNIEISKLGAIPTSPSFEEGIFIKGKRAVGKGRMTLTVGEKLYENSNMILIWLSQIKTL